MNEQFALFLFEDYYPGGGVNDLAHIGTMEECIAFAEKQDEVIAFDNAEIVSLPALKVVKHRKYVFIESYLTAVPHTHRHEWIDGPPTCEPE